MEIWHLTIVLSSLTLVACLLGIGRIVRNYDQQINKQRTGDAIVEGVFVYLLPPIGLLISNNPCDIHPFDLEQLLTPWLLWFLVATGHFLSKLWKKQLSPLLLLVISSLMILGVLFCLSICVHFSTHIYIALFPGYQLPYLSPLFCLLYLLRELYNLNAFLKEALVAMNTPADTALRGFYAWLEKYRLGFSLYMLAPIIALLQSLLYLFGQRPDSLISQFTESCGFLLSNQQSCNCGGDHYLCSVAANGDKKLVKPVRMGFRKNEKILVNRQLLVANAFESWLEQYTPRFHKAVRSFYDGCNIPVNAWSKKRRLANLIYLLMKPLECFFLLWLYLFDKHPESRIAKQYLPKKELEQFINTHPHENNH